jgi:hypothetical protein
MVTGKDIHLFLLYAPPTLHFRSFITLCLLSLLEKYLCSLVPQIKPTHAGFSHVRTVLPQKKKPAKFVWGEGVKGRSEPWMLRQVVALTTPHYHRHWPSLISSPPTCVPVRFAI